MNKALLIVTIIFTLIVVLTGCSNEDNNKSSSEEEKPVGLSLHEQYVGTVQLIVDDVEYEPGMTKEHDQRVESCRKTLSDLGDTEFYCAMLDDDMIGRLIFHKSRDEDKPDTGEIGAIYLLAEYWGKGYGKQMMDFALCELKREGFQEIITWVLEENKRARLFYEKCGFKPDGAKRDIEIGRVLKCVRYMISLT